MAPCFYCGGPAGAFLTVGALVLTLAPSLYPLTLGGHSESGREAQAVPSGIRSKWQGGGPNGALQDSTLEEFLLDVFPLSSFTHILYLTELRSPTRHRLLVYTIFDLISISYAHSVFHPETSDLCGCQKPAEHVWIIPRSASIRVWDFISLGWVINSPSPRFACVIRRCRKTKLQCLCSVSKGSGNYSNKAVYYG